jgi:hypothetical protein
MVELRPPAPSVCAQMSIQRSLLDLLSQSRSIEQAFLTGLPEAERRGEGTATDWSAKDVIAHLADWRLQDASKLAAVAAGETPPDTPELDSTNAVVFERHRSQSWDNVSRFSAGAWSSLARAIESLPEEKLTSPSDLPSMRGRPWWRFALVDVATHPVEHLAGYAAAHGRQAEATGWQEESASRIEALDTDPAWRGTVRYNLACYYALAGHTAKAIQTLGAALGLNPDPDLIEWSRKDTDLESLRNEPGYHALYEGHT